MYKGWKTCLVAWGGRRVSVCEKQKWFLFVEHIEGNFGDTGILVSGGSLNCFKVYFLVQRFFDEFLFLFIGKLSHFVLKFKWIFIELLRISALFSFSRVKTCSVIFPPQIFITQRRNDLFKRTYWRKIGWKKTNLKKGEKMLILLLSILTEIKTKAAVLHENKRTNWFCDKW